MNKSNNGRLQCATACGGDSPRLLRSRSGNAAATAAFPQTRSVTTSKHSRPPKTEENSNITAKKAKKKPDAGRDISGGLAMFLPRSASRVEVPRRSRSASTSPSAWALSPGRSLPSPAAAVRPEKSTKQEGKGRGGGMGGVLKYFRQKKVSRLVEEEYHGYRVVHNRLLQWRFANARAEASMAAVKRVAQKNVSNGWVRISIMRNLVMEKRSLMEKLKHEMKLYQILKSEMRLLNEWCKVEPKNVEAIGRVVRKLSAVSLCLPLVQDAEADTMSVHDAISTATEVMDNIKAVILDMHWQVERTSFLLTELSAVLKQQKHFFQELEKRAIMITSLEVEEKSLISHHIQLAME